MRERVSVCDKVIECLTESKGGLEREDFVLELQGGDKTPPGGKLFCWDVEV